MHGSTTTCFLLLSWGALTTLVRTDDAVEGPLVHTAVGAVRGFSQCLRGTVVNTFIGIRYGKAPTGELRFREPQPAEPWSGVLNATETPPACIQGNVYRGVEWAVPDETEQSEDCLFLNVWSPVVPPSTSNLTVMVWIHGGGFSQGSSSLPVYDGAFLAAFGHVVVVSMNYRLGSLGFLQGNAQSAPGNHGLLDQSLALRWVRDNIACFGGDPGSVTLFGESAGSQSVLFHLLSPASRPHFQRAILQSGSLCTRSTKYSDHRRLAKAHYLARNLNCTRFSDPYAYLQEDEIECLRRVDTRQIRVAEELACSGRNCFRAIFGTSSLPDPCAVVDSGDKDILIGTVENEGGFFASYWFPVGFSLESSKNLTINQTQLLLAPLIETPSPEFLNDIYDLYTGSLRDTDFVGLKRAVQDAWGDKMINCPTILTSLTLASNPQNRVFHYVLNHTSDRAMESPWYGMTHFDDVEYVFGRPLLENRSSDDQTYSKKLIELWTSFAKKG
ncbi:acetylcholinesterase, putative [Ixodes scapularis]|uniref:Carboxylic ester hydrolase n=1 Tax=Ixodes scapularis TaxID=6945 RepID=B7PR61_IXOSC|nr:acetylcholinesterase, putative [Ixodes scapularis]|eukprot:XP_002436253.1 acetylcholinesterase, putative [Ixodes scapularis]